MDIAASQVYANFRAWVPRNVIPVGIQKPQEWVYYDWGPRNYPEPLICLHGLTSSAEVFFHQVTSLAPRGYRVIAIEIGEYWSVSDFADAFQSFLDTTGLSRVHVYGVDLGGFLALSYVSKRSERIASILLTHSYLTTENLQLGTAKYPLSVLKWIPEFLVRAAIRDIVPKAPTDTTNINTIVEGYSGEDVGTMGGESGDSGAVGGDVAEFSVMNALKAPRAHLAARLSMAKTKASVVGKQIFPEDRITLIDSTVRTRERDVEICEETAAHLPGAKRALLKTGGDLPYVSVSDEVNMHIIVHLRRHAPAPTEFPTIPPPALLPKAWQLERSSSPRPVDDTDPAVEEDGEEESNHIENRVQEPFPGTPQESEKVKYIEEVAKLREFLPDKDDEYLTAVLSQSGGSIDVAIAKVIEHDRDAQQ